MATDFSSLPVNPALSLLSADDNMFEHGFPRSFVKTPDERLAYGVDYENYLAAGEVISLLEIEISPDTLPPLRPVSVGYTDGTALAFLIEGGAADTAYTVTVRAHTTYQVLIDTFSLETTTGLAGGVGFAVTPYGIAYP